MGINPLFSYIHEYRCMNIYFLNVKGEAVIDEHCLKQAWSALQQKEQADFIILQGNGINFCKGLDINYLLQQGEQAISVQSLLKMLADFLSAVDEIPQPVIAKVDGDVMGGGMGLLAVADLVIANPKASFSLPETMIGLIPGVVFPYVCRRLGIVKAKGLAMGIQTFDANKAFHHGLVDEVDDDVEGRLSYYVKRLGRMDSEAIKSMKELIHKHYPVTSNYINDAITTFERLFNSDSTKHRLGLFNQGLAPWLND